MAAILPGGRWVKVLNRYITVPYNAMMESADNANDRTLDELQNRFCIKTNL